VLQYGQFQSLSGINPNNRRRHLDFLEENRVLVLVLVVVGEMVLHYFDANSPHRHATRACTTNRKKTAFEICA
jgi:hypothetical protein